MNEKKSVRYIIYHEYLKAALIPILVVELMLLIMYFAITGYVESRTKDTLLQEARNNITEISSREVKNINLQLGEITKLSAMLQKDNTRFFRQPDSFGLPGGTPAFAVSGNGVYYKTADNGGSSVWYSSLTPVTDQVTRKALKTEAMDPLFKVVQESNPNIVGIYFNSYDSMCRYYPFLPNVYDVFAPNMNIPEFNFYYLADQSHNPEKGPVWTDAYLDPAGQGWMASCIVPIYNEAAFLEGVTGIDITIDSFVRNILNLQLPWDADAFLVDKNGVILAMPESIEDILDLKELREQVYHATVKQDTLKPEEFNLLKNKDPQIAEQIRQIFESGTPINDFTVKDNSYFLTQSIINETGWRLMILVGKDKVLEPVYQLDRLTKRTGLLAFGLMVLFYALFFSYLLYKSRHIADRIADPIVSVARKTGEMIFDLQNVKFDEQDNEISEIQLLTKNFTSMAEELQRFYEELESKVKQRTQELTEMYDTLQDSNHNLQLEIIERKRAEGQLEEHKQELEKAYNELKNANMQIIHQEKMASIGQLAAGVAHEINNPMGFIISNVSLMEEYAEKLIAYLNAQEEAYEPLLATHSTDIAITDPNGSIAGLKALKKKLGIDFIKKDVADIFSETLEGTTRVKNIVQELRNFSRNEVVKNMGDINKGIESVINIIWNELKYKVTLEKDYGQLPLTYCSMGQLSQVFMNLLLNAAQAIEDHGKIHIRTAVDAQDIVITIADTGSGIPADIMSKIFDPFFTTKEIGKGTGLGLSVSYEIIKAHAGLLSVESEPGVGTTFTIRLPIVSSEPEEE